ncbi:hypothetical protein ACOMHN_004348 [Nucella lapillus]
MPKMSQEDRLLQLMCCVNAKPSREDRVQHTVHCVCRHGDDGSVAGQSSVRQCSLGPLFPGQSGSAVWVHCSLVSTHADSAVWVHCLLVSPQSGSAVWVHCSLVSQAVQSGTTVRWSALMQTVQSGSTVCWSVLMQAVQSGSTVRWSVLSQAVQSGFTVPWSVTQGLFPQCSLLSGQGSMAISEVITAIKSSSQRSEVRVCDSHQVQ